MAKFLAMSSQVASGHIGLSAIVPALQSLGHEVIAVPTILLSNHPGHRHVSARRTDVAFIDDMIAALARNGWLHDIDAVLTGYLPSADHVACALRTFQTIDRARQTADRAPVELICDPVLGDHPKGLYIEEAAAIAIRDMLLPAARLATPNAFEMEWLTGRAIAGADDVAAAAATVGGPQWVVTSVPVGSGELANVEVLARSAGEPANPPKVASSKTQANIPNGTGDLFAAVYAGLSHLSPTHPDPLQTATRFLADVCAASTGTPELYLVAQLPRLRELALRPDAQAGSPIGASPS